MSPKTTHRTASIILHSRRGACLVEHVLRERGFVIDTNLAPIMDFSAYDAMAADVLFVGGGPVGVYQADLYPFLHHEIDIIRRRLAAGKVVIGICLGAQLMAAALGARVYKGAQGYEAGWSALKILDDVPPDHPARHFCSSATKIFHWHGDTFDMPQGENIRLLASTDKYPHQMFSVGNYGIAIQFHPEVHRAQMPEWSVCLVDELTGNNPVVPLEQFKKDTENYIDAAEKQTRAFLNNFLDTAGV